MSKELIERLKGNSILRSKNVNVRNSLLIDAAGRIEELEKQRDDLLTICRNVVERGIGASDVKAMKAAIASANADQFRDATKKTDDTSAPAIVFYPAGSLGESVDSEGGEA